MAATAKDSASATARYGAWQSAIRIDPTEAGPRSIRRCRQISNRLLEMARQGIGDNDEEQRAEWMDLTSEMSQPADNARWLTVLEGWVAARVLSSECAESLIRIQNLAPLGFPGLVDVNKRGLVEELER